MRMVIRALGLIKFITFFGVCCAFLEEPRSKQFPLKRNAHDWLGGENNDGKNLDKRCQLSQNKEQSSYLWRISSQPPSYLFGTLHVAHNYVWPYIDPIVKRIFTEADALFFELDLTNINTLTRLSQCQLLPHNQTVTNVLPNHVINRIEDFIDYSLQNLRQWSNAQSRERAIYIHQTVTKNWQNKRPMWILILLHSLTHGEFLDTSTPVLDLFMAQEARNVGKPCGAVEDVEDQCDPINQVDNKMAIVALEITLDRLTVHQSRYHYTHSEKVIKSEAINPKTSIPRQALPIWQRQDYPTPSISHPEDPIQTMISHYNCGTLELLSSEQPNKLFFLGQRVQVFPKEIEYFTKGHLSKERAALVRKFETLTNLENHLNDELILKRNQKMSARIREKLHWSAIVNKSAFFAIGAAHFIGETNSIIHYLRQYGYKITPISRTDIRKVLKTTESGDAELHRTSRNQRKYDVIPSLQNEDDIPEFRPKYVQFGKSMVKIEEFSSHVLKNQPRQSWPQFPNKPEESPHVTRPKIQPEHQRRFKTSPKQNKNSATSISVSFFILLFFILYRFW